jgi:hypothetical protein
MFDDGITHRTRLMKVKKKKTPIVDREVLTFASLHQTSTETLSGNPQTIRPGRQAAAGGKEREREQTRGWFIGWLRNQGWLELMSWHQSLSIGEGR